MTISNTERTERQACGLLAEAIAGQQRAVADLYQICVNAGRHTVIDAQHPQRRPK